MQAIQRRGRFAAALLVAAGLICGGLSAAAALEVGDKAPDFALAATTAEQVKLSDFTGKKHLVLFFYVGAFTGV